MDRRTVVFIILMAVSFYVIQLFFHPTKELPSTPPPKGEEVKIPEACELEKKPVIEQESGEAYYVIENEFQQLVFSNIGGCLTEINLPFHTKENNESVVNEIKFDKQIINSSKSNATFPLSSYNIFENGKIVKKEGSLSGYNPLLRRKIIGSDIIISPKFYALNIVSDNENIDNAKYNLVRLEKNLVEFELDLPNRKIIKTYQLAKDAPYIFELSISIEGDSKNLWITTGVPEVELTSGRYEPILKMRSFKNHKSVVDKLSLPKTQNSLSSIYPDWICNSNGFFGIIIDPLVEIAPGYRSKYIDGTSFPTRLSLIDPQYNLYPANKYPGYEMFLPLKGEAQKTSFRIFAGPFSKDILKAVDATYSNATTGYSPDYVGAQSFHGIFAFISEPFAKLMFILMQLFHKTTSSWGISIILLTLVLRIMLYPLNAWAIKSQMRMQEISPKIQEIQKRYAKNPEKAKLEQMKLFREKGANPLMGCFPIFIQLPFLIGMYDLLKSSFELRGTPFIRGWIDNLTSPDVVFSWSYPIPLIGTEFHALPIIMGIVMFLQSKFTTTTPKKVSEMTDQQRQQKALSTLMPIIFTVIFYKMPSGLNIYYLFFSLFGIIQQWYMNRRTKKKFVKV